MKSVQGSHVTVNEICEYFKNQGISVGTTTVYRHLEKMVREGVVAKYVVDGTSSACFEYTGESPRNGSSGGFLFRFWIWWLKPQAGYRLFVTIQPFDDVVAGYTSRDSDNERENIIHNSSPPFRTWYRRR